MENFWVFLKMRKEVLHQVGWMKEFRFTKYESACIKLGMIRNESDIAYMFLSREVFWASRDAVVWVEDSPSNFFYGEKNKR